MVEQGVFQGTSNLSNEYKGNVKVETEKKARKQERKTEIIKITLAILMN